MICPSCQGQPMTPPCATCGGSGIAYCCEGDVLAKYSTPGLRKNTLSRSAKKAHLQAQGVKPDDIEKVLAELYPSNP